MHRLVALAVFAALCLALALAPGPDPAHLAARSSGSLLDAEVVLGGLATTVGEALELGIGEAELVLTPPEDEVERTLQLALVTALGARGQAPVVRHDQGGARLRLEVRGLDGELPEQHFQLDPQGTDLPPLDVVVPLSLPTKSALLPPLVAIALAVLFRRTIPALFLGVWVGATLLVHQRSATWAAPIEGGLEVFTHFLYGRLASWDNTRTILFVVAMLSMVGLLVRSGGLAGVMNSVARRANSARGSQVATWLMGLFIFFDDYSNTVLVGSTMRPLTDRFRVAREKLAYLVDSTAAPVAGLSLLSTWIAFEVSTFSPQLPSAGIAPEAGYGVFLETLPFRFYSILTLCLVGIVTLGGRDFGPMLRAERRARRTGQLVAPGSRPMVGEATTRIAPAEGVTPRAINALVPLFAFVLVTLGTILVRGGAFAMDPAALFRFEGLSGVLLAGSGSIPLLVGSTTGLLLAAGACWREGIAREIPGAAWAVLSSMGQAFAILYLAWMIGDVCGELDTAGYLTALLGVHVDPLLLPALLFGLAALVAFSTGSSWSTMMILLPLVVALAFQLGSATEVGGYFLMLMSIGAVLEGSIFGDHCSPISDTTVLSSISSASDHVDHVRTQAPYALLTMGAALVFGYLPVARGWWPAWVGLLLALGFLIGWMRLVGRRPDEA
ncbi:MAG: Na+/H+ antiporter NhaC family protein [Planctomycetota bacterium]|nr:Na+/H+ antiporter NhaC family protein [Planctomycetota bacterium]